jgi:Flp pilus assembly protein TadG
MRLGDDSGGAAAEFAVAMPAVMLVLVVLLGGVQAGGRQLRAYDAAADAARSWARGDTGAVVEARLGRQLPGAAVVRSGRGDLVCATVTAASRIGIAVRGWACALGGGR